MRRMVGPSLTATVVAAVRACYAELPAPWGVAPDPVARHLVPSWLALPALAAGHAGRASATALHLGLGATSLGLTYHIALRTHAIDVALLAAVADGIPQVVLLGAGLDNRALRLPALASTRVFEVDHPATQSYKRLRLSAAGRAEPAQVTPVAVDFERDRLDEALLGAGFSSTERAFWIWEGVTVYLTRAAIRGTLDAVARASAPGSLLAMTYTRPGSVGGALFEGLTAMMATVIGEPVRGALSSDDLRLELERAGLALRADESPQEWANEVWGGAPPGLREWERLAIAERVAGGGASDPAR